MTSDDYVKALREWMVKPYGGIHATGELMGEAANEIERLRKIAAKYDLLAADGDRCAELVATAYDEWDTDIPWFRQLDCAVAECQAPNRFTAEAKEGYCIHCSRVMGEHSKGDLYCARWWNENSSTAAKARSKEHYERGQKRNKKP